MRKSEFHVFRFTINSSLACFLVLFCFLEASILIAFSRNWKGICFSGIVPFRALFDALFFFRVQPHLKKCFEGIARLRFNEDLEVLAIVSTEGEEVDLLETISTAAARGQVEKWLVQLETEMRKCIHNAVHQSLLAYHVKERTTWVLEWPGQTILCVGQTYWTEQVEEAMLMGIDGMKAYLDQCQEELNEIILLIRGTLSKQNRVTLGTRMD